MKLRNSIVIPAALAILLTGIIGLAFADGLNNNEVEFTGAISSLVVNGEGVGTVFIRLGNYDMRVVINPKTEILKLNGDQLGMDALKEGARVEITGKYSSSGVLASRIRLVESPDSDFQLRGMIKSVETSGSQTLLMLQGIQVIVNEDTKIEVGGAAATASILKPGLQVKIEGAVTAEGWIAASVAAESAGNKKEQVRFEGTVVSLTGDSMEVAVQGLPSNTTKVLLEPKTKIPGTLMKDVLVLVIGTLNVDLTVTAREVRALQALEIKPDEKKLKVGETSVFIIGLRESAPTDVPVTLKAGDTSIVALSSSLVTVAKGSKAAEFKLTGLKTGSTQVTAEALGQEAAAEIRVGEVSEDENENHGGQAVAIFAPEKIKMGLRETRDVVLLIKPPQKSKVEVDLKATRELVTIAIGDYSNGAAALKVTIQSGDKEGTDSVVATLPKDLGGGKAELLVEIAAGNNTNSIKEKAVIEFRPDSIKLAVGESLAVELFSSQSFDKDVSIAIDLTKKDAFAEVASTLVLAAGTKSVKLTVKGNKEGKTFIVAAMPKDLGGDTAKLTVEIDKK
jgi:hypothetical protein